MTVPLRLLLIEDSSDDAQLIVRTIQRGGYEVEYERVDREAELRTALSSEGWDLIICDFSLPSFNAIRALELLKASGQDLPFMIVSGSISEEMAVTALRAGAHDFMVKGNMARLAPAIERELKEAETRRERKQAEEALRKATDFAEAVIQTANVIFLQLDSAGRVLRINSAAEDITGYKPSEIEGRNWAETLLPRDRYPEPWKEFDSIMKVGGEPAPFENPILTKKGEERTILWKNKPLTEGDRVTGIISFGIDITERKRVEAALKDAEARYRQLVERIPAITYVVSTQPPYETLYVSPQVEKFLGFTQAEWIADPRIWEKQLHPADRQRVLAEAETSLEGKGTFVSEYRIITRDGRTIWLHDETFHVDEADLPSFSQGIEFDITERKHGEEALREAESRYRILVEQLPMIVYVNTPGDIGQTEYVSPQVETILGYTAQEWLSDPKYWQKLLHPDDRDAVLEKVEQVKLAGNEFSMEYRVLARDGHAVWFRDHAVPVTDISGQVLRWQGLMIDITAAKRREREWEAIARLSQALREQRTVNEVLPQVLDETLSLMETDQGSIWLRDPVSDEIRLELQRHWNKESPGSYPRGRTIPEIVMETGQAVVVRELRTDLRLPEEHRARIPAGVGGACVPLSATGKTFGALFVNVRLPREITPDELRVLEALANVGANAIHRARLFEETMKHLDRLAALRSIDIAISSSFDLKMVLNVVLDKITGELGVDAAGVLLLNPDSLMLEYAAGKGFWTRHIQSSSLSLGEGLPGNAIIERSVSYVDDLNTPHQSIKRSYLLTDEKFVSYYGVPLVAKGKIKGVLEIFNRTPLANDTEWMQFLESLAGQTAIAIDSAATFQDLQRSNMDLALAYDATIEGWSHALDLRDRETEGHTIRVTDAAIKLARAIGMDEEALVQVRRGGLLHDIGKMGVPDSVLLKPGKLTDEEWEMMRKHPLYAHDMLYPIAYLRPALDIPYCHHEKWDGTGYPRGLKGNEIPLVARIFAVVDVWDALCSDRPYRPRWKTEDVLNYLRQESGKHFDPAVTEVFLNLVASQVIGLSGG